MSIVHRPGRPQPYMVRVMVRGKRHTQSFATRHEAQAWEAQMKGARVNDAPVPQPVRAAGMTVAEAAVMVGTGMRDGSIRTHRGKPYKRQSVDKTEILLRRWVLPRVGAMDVRDVDRFVVIRMREQIARDMSPASAKEAVKALAVVTRWLADTGRIDTYPCRALPAWRVDPRKALWLTPEQGVALQERADADGNPRIGTFVAIALGTAARRGEIEAATWGPGDMDTEEGVWTISKTLRQDGTVSDGTKNGGTRAVPLGPALLERLRAIRGDAPDGERVVGPYPVLAWDRVRQMGAGEQVPRLHDLRATAIAWMLSAGVNVVAAARHAGHDPQVLLTHYAAAMPTDVSGVAIALESVTAPGVVHAGAGGVVARTRV